MSHWQMLMTFYTRRSIQSPHSTPFRVPCYTCFRRYILCNLGYMRLYPGLLVYMGYVHIGGALMYGFTTVQVELL